MDHATIMDIVAPMPPDESTPAAARIKERQRAQLQLLKVLCTHETMQKRIQEIYTLLDTPGVEEAQAIELYYELQYLEGELRFFHRCVETLPDQESVFMTALLQDSPDEFFMRDEYNLGEVETIWKSALAMLSELYDGYYSIDPGNHYLPETWEYFG